MRWSGRVAAVVVVLAVLAFLGLSWWLPRWLASTGFEERLRAAVERATGLEPRWSELEVGILPPRLRVADVRLVDPAAPAGAPPALAVANADLRLELWPLLFRTLVVDRVVADGASLRLVRTAAGVALSGEPLAKAGGSAPAPASAARAGGDSGHRGGFDLAVRRVDLRGGHLSLEDRTVEPPVVLVLEDVGAHLRGRALDAPVAIEAQGRLASGGDVSLEGTATPDGSLDLQATLEGVALAPFAPYGGGSDVELGGSADGTIHVRGPARAPDALDADLELADAAFQVGDAQVHGPVTLRAELRGPLGRPHGTFAIDASRAELVYGGRFRIRKPPGAAATAEGRIETAADGRVTADDVRVRLRNLGGDARLQWGGGRPFQLALDAPAFDVAGWGESLPALAPLAPEGRIALEDLRVALAPLSLAGRIRLASLVLRPDGRGPIAFEGALVGAGDGLRSEDLVARAGEQPVSLELAVAGLAGTPRHHLRLATHDADASALLGALAGRPDALEGPLTVSADLTGPLGEEPAMLAGLAGTAALAAGPGRIPGVAPLRLALGGIDSLAGGRRGEALRRFYGDRFDSLTGHFAVREGRAHTDDLVLRYPGYALEIAGTVELASRRLDASGHLVLEESLYAALAGREPEPGARPRALPLAEVRGTLDEPRITVEQQAVIALAATLATAGKREKVERKLDKWLGKGSGRALLDGLFEQR